MSHYMNMSNMVGILFLMSISIVGAIFDIPDFEPLTYNLEGDIIIGGLWGPTHYTAEGSCSKKMRTPTSFQFMEAVVWKIKEINKDYVILPNITVGIAFVDDCAKDRIAVSRSIQFLKPNDKYGCNSSLGSGDKFPPLDVSAVLSTTSSTNTMAMAGFLGMYRIPVVGAVSTAELLSNRRKFPYFERFMPSDLYQARAIVDIMTRYNWSYVSVINSEGTYGEKGAESIVQIANSRGICIAYLHTLKQSRGVQEYETAAVNVLSDKRVKVVVLFMHSKDSGKLLKEMNKRHGDQRYVFLVSDAGSTEDLSPYPNLVEASFFIKVYGMKGTAEFYSYYETMKVTDTKNPWLPYVFEQQAKCSWTSSENKCDPNLTIGQLSNYFRSGITSLFTDSIMTMLKALDNMIKEKCPEVTLNRGKGAKDCVRDGLMPYLEKTMREVEGQYKVSQLQKDSNNEDIFVSVGRWTLSDLNLRINEDDVRWQNDDNSIPDSICSYPCLKKQFKIQLKLKCCWECRYCASNEKVIRNHTSCETCQPFYWPDNETALECLPIEHTYYRLDSTTSYIVIAIALAGITLCVCTFTYLIINREKKLIKATGLHIGVIGLLGELMAYPSAILMIVPPSDATCYLAPVTMHIGFCLTYTSMLTKTNRIFRIFRAAKHSAKRPSFIANKYQVVFISIMLSIQIIIISLSTAIKPTAVKLRMPLATQKFVEKLCEMPLQTFLPPVVYNLLLISACGVYAMKTRKLPDNFNESKLIFLLVLATSFLWMAFLPTYFTAVDAQQKVLLLVMLLVISSFLTTFCLHFPKVYATLYVDENTMNLKRGVTSVGDSSTS